MKVTYKGDYALKAILDLSLHYDKELVTSHGIAQRIDAPLKFLEQVLLDLKKGGFVESRRGSIGGYLLAKSPDKITVGQVLRVIEGPIEPIACVEKGYSNCTDITRCVFRSIWHKVAQATSDIVDNISFEELVSQVNAGQQVLTCSI
jgi:Rrf2 family protein